MSQSPADDLSIGERLHDGHIPGRPISWVVVGLVIGGFVVGGIGLILALPWLVIACLCVIAAATILGWLTHAMADTTPRVETPTRLAKAAERQPDDAEPSSGGSSREPARS
jgi:hypothetical protein